MRRFRELRPGIDVRLHEDPYDDVLTAQLERGRLDLAFGPLGVQGPFEEIELLRDPYVLLAPEDSPLAGLDAAPTLREIGRLPLIAYGRSSYGVEARLRSRGIEPDVVFRTDESRALQRLVGAGVGHAVVPLDEHRRAGARHGGHRRLAARAAPPAGHRLAPRRDAARGRPRLPRRRGGALCGGAAGIGRRHRGEGTGMSQTVTPYLLYEDADAAIDFLTRAFGFREVDRTPGEAGGLHAELDVGDGSQVFVGQPVSGYRGPAVVGQTCLVYVLIPSDADGHAARARDAGGRIIEEPNDTAYGQRRYGVEDPQGHHWFFGAPLRAR